MLNVTAVMSKKVVSVSPDDRLFLIRDLFNHVEFTHLPVVDENSLLIGFISISDVQYAISPYLGTNAETQRDIDTQNKRAHQIMSRDLVTIHDDMDIYDVAKLMINKKIKSLPVLKKGTDNELVGIVSWIDILKYYTFKEHK